MAVQLRPPDVSTFKVRTTFEDGLGVRVCAFDNPSGQLLETLCLRPTLTAAPSFEFALRERTATLANFRPESYSHVRRAEHVGGASGGLVVVSEHVAGARLSKVLDLAERHRVRIDFDSVLHLTRQLLRAVRLLHDVAPGVSHGALAPERLIVTPEGRFVVAEYVLGSALERVQFTRQRLWRDLHIAMPATVRAVRFDQRVGVTQIGAVALSLVLGRPLTVYEYPGQLDGLLNLALEASVPRDQEPRLPALRTWLSRAPQLDLRRSFPSAGSALVALDDVLTDQAGGGRAARRAPDTARPLRFFERVTARRLRTPNPEPGIPDLHVPARLCHRERSPRGPARGGGMLHSYIHGRSDSSHSRRSAHLGKRFRMRRTPGATGCHRRRHPLTARQ